MTQYIIRRLAQMIPITFGILTLVFSLIHLVPGDPAVQIAGENARPEDVRQVRHALGPHPPRVPDERERGGAGPPALPGHDRARPRIDARGAPGGVPARHHLGDLSRQMGRQRRALFCAARRVDAELLVRPAADHRVCDQSPVASRLRARRRAEVAHPPGADDGPGAVGNPNAHDPREPRGRTDAALRHDGDREGGDARQGDFPPRAEECADPGDHSAGAAIRLAADRRDHHGADFLVAGAGAAADRLDLEARLPAGAGVDSRHRPDVHLREFRERPAVRRGRPEDQAGMKRLRQLLRNFAFTAGLIVTVALIVAALAAPLIAPFDPNVQDTSRRLEAPSHDHLLGLDELGRDVLSRILWGARVSLRVGFSVVILASLGGLSLGAISGYFGGSVDTILMRLTDILLAFPGILLAIALVAVLGPSLNNVVLALVTIGWVAYAR